MFILTFQDNGDYIWLIIITLKTIDDRIIYFQSLNKAF